MLNPPSVEKLNWLVKLPEALSVSYYDLDDMSGCVINKQKGVLEVTCLCLYCVGAAKLLDETHFVIQNNGIKRP